MCLRIKENQTVCIAENDITVYKTCDRTQIKNLFRTTFQNAEVHIGETYTSSLIVSRVMHLQGYKIDIGLHSFAKCEDAKKLANYYSESVIKCTIPKGSLYYKGAFESVNGDCECYASGTLRYDKVLKHYTEKK